MINPNSFINITKVAFIVDVVIIMHMPPAYLNIDCCCVWCRALSVVVGLPTITLFSLLIAYGGQE